MSLFVWRLLGLTSAALMGVEQQGSAAVGPDAAALPA